MEGPLWVVLVVGTVLTIIFYRHQSMYRARRHAHAVAMEMKTRLKEQLYYTDTSLHRGVYVNTKTDILPKPTKWLRIRQFRPWLIIEFGEDIERGDVKEVLEKFVREFQEKWDTDVPFVRTTILQDTADVSGEVS